MHRHGGDEPAAAQQRHADDGPDPGHPVGAQIRRFETLVVDAVTDDPRLTGPHRPHAAVTELRHRKAPGQRRQTGVVVAAHQEVVLILFGFGVGTAIRAEVLPEAAGGVLHDPLGVVQLLQSALEPGEKPLPLRFRPPPGGVQPHAANDAGAHARVLFEPNHVPVRGQRAVGDRVVALLPPRFVARLQELVTVFGMHDRGRDRRVTQPAAGRPSQHGPGAVGDERVSAAAGVGFPHDDRQAIEDIARTRLRRRLAVLCFPVHDVSTTGTPMKRPDRGRDHRP